MAAVLRQPDILRREAGAAGTQELAETGAPVKLSRVGLSRELATLIFHLPIMPGHTRFILITPVVGPLVVGTTEVWVSA